MSPLDRLLAMRARIDALAVGEVPKVSRGLWAPRAKEPRALLELDRRLDEAGVFTRADAQVLAELAAERDPDALEVWRSLRERAKRAEREMEKLLRAEERRARRAGRVGHDVAPLLEDLWVRLKRVVVTAEVLAHPDAPPAADSFELLGRTRPENPPKSPRLAVAEFLAHQAKASPLAVSQKRWCLAAAHELLLAIGEDQERERTVRLRSEVAQARRRADARLGHDPVKAMEIAATAGMGSQVWAGARELFLDAIQTGNPELAGAARALLEQVRPGVQGSLAQARAHDRGEVVLAESPLADSLIGRAAPNAARDPLSELASGFDAARWQVFDLAAGVSGFFDAEGDEENELIMGPAQRVPYPTSRMEIDVAHSVAEAPGFVVEDPRLIVYDLASERQLVRAWYQPGEVEQRRRGAVRLYVCDASGSMKGDRARFRDALLLAELSNLAARAAQGRSFTPLYFSFFNDIPTDLARIDSPAKAMAAAQVLLAESKASGQTDITLALECAFRAVHEARGQDPNLGRATVVLVTDGQDAVELDRIEAARAPVGSLAISLSFISVGNVNADLQRLVAQQRAAGRRAFYFHVRDEEAKAGRTTFDTGRRTLLPERPRVVLADPAGLAGALGRLRGVAEKSSQAQARARAAERFPTYFATAPADAETFVPGVSERVEALVVAVEEAIAMAPPESRRAEAVEILEHLLRTFRLTSADFFAAASHATPKLREALQGIALLCPNP